MPTDEADPADEQARRLATESLAAGDPTGWFERLYASAEQTGVGVPWDRKSPQQLLVDWTHTNRVTGDGKRALVVGCGLGDDAEHVASLGFDTTAFDIAPSAVREARHRFPESPVHYLPADLLEAPASWHRAFDLVVESITVQAMPPPMHESAAAAIAGFVRPGGTLLVIAAAHDERDGPTDGPPWPLTRAELAAFAADGVDAVRTEKIAQKWRATFRRD